MNSSLNTYIPSPARYDEMQYRRCGKSGIVLPAISLGLWHNFGQPDEYTNSRAIALFAFDKGITHFDLANNYGPPPGAAEETFGKILSDDLGKWRHELFISTKAGYLMWPGPYGEFGSRKYLLSSLDQSLKRMKLEYVDLFYSHRYDPDTPLEETMSALHSAVVQGKALYAGISNYPADKTREASQILRSMGTPCLIHQPRYHMLDRSVEAELLDVLDTEGIGCIAYSPLAQGVLTDRYIKGIPADSRVAKPHGVLQQNRVNDSMDKVIRLNDLAQSRGQSLAQMALSWLLKDQRLTSVLVGTSSVKQLENTLGCLKNLAFSPEELAVVEHILG